MSGDFRQGVAGAPPPGLVLYQDALFHEVLDIAQRRVLGTLDKLRPFR